MKCISKLYPPPLNSDDNSTPLSYPLHLSPRRVLLILIWMESLSLHWREYEGWGIFRLLSIGSRPFSGWWGGVGPGREHEIDADGIDVDVGPYVENTIHKKYRLLARSRLISESRLPYWFQLLNPLQSAFHQKPDERERWRAKAGLLSFEQWTDEIVESSRAFPLETILEWYSTT